MPAVPAETVALAGQGVERRGAGEITARLSAKTAHEEHFPLTVRALVDEWREVPVARYELRRGDIIGESDVVMARLNAGAIPKDVWIDRANIVGQETVRDIAAGDPIRRSRTSAPIVISSGSMVVMIYRSSALEATATGVALEDGAAGQEIRVRNDASKRIVRAVARETGMVEVRQ
jgi:flagella basal body P-ring formation protein FlgA